MTNVTLPEKKLKKSEHLTLRVPHELRVLVKEVRLLARDRRIDAALSLEKVIWDWAASAREALVQMERAA